MKFTIYAIASLFAASTPSASASSAFKALANLPADIISNLPHDMSIPGNLYGRDMQVMDLCEENCCTPCANGDTPTNLDGVIPEELTEGETITCSDGAAMVGFLPADSEECPLMQLFGHVFCGCPSLPTVEGVEPCALCSDGSAIPDPSKEVQSEGETMTCGTLQFGVYFLDAFMDMNSTDTGTELPGDSELCPLMQSMYGPMCDCPEDPNAPSPCGICPEGMELENPDLEVSVDGGETMTCAEGEMSAALFPADDDLCELIKSEAKSLGCTCKAGNGATVPTSTGRAIEAGIVGASAAAVATMVMAV